MSYLTQNGVNFETPGVHDVRCYALLGALKAHPILL